MHSADEPVSVPAVSTTAAAEDGGKSPVSPSMEEERQIPVDPVSLRHLGMVADPDSPLSAPSVLTEVVAQSSPLLPPLRRPTFVGASQPCSATSSPVHSATAKRDEPAAPSLATVTALRSLARQHSAALASYAASPSAAPTTLSRSASPAEGRSMAPHDDEVPVPYVEAADEDEQSFTCGVLCMFIPGFAKKKPGSPSAAAVVSSIQRQHSGARRRSSVSRMAELERFECGSWSPPPPPHPVRVVPTHVDMDFAMEVPKISCADDTDLPVKMAFVFEGEARGALKKSASDSRRHEPASPAKTASAFDGEPRGILKKSASASQRQDSAPRTSSASQRHVRFSTAAAPPASCPTSPCITPRLAMARAEFNAFLEAQSA
ncbi:uncharacterized protein KIAA0754-like [Triticum dicoccoides]|uniref:uncharacterized protein KIAA0754-like n=1 Tax=Triticum dicoccoides TaxID=85692 RepID=UPI0018911971|nr:uncharacterized protein KIAA0754-like [Triticum dicoccoides]